MVNPRDIAGERKNNKIRKKKNYIIVTDKQAGDGQRDRNKRQDQEKKHRSRAQEGERFRSMLQIFFPKYVSDAQSGSQGEGRGREDDQAEDGKMT